jgi:hypothetical protein
MSQEQMAARVIPTVLWLSVGVKLARGLGVKPYKLLEPIR